MSSHQKGTACLGVPMELWDLIKHLAHFSSVFHFQATSNQLSRHAALSKQGPVLLQLPSEHILLAPLQVGVLPAPWQMWLYTPPASCTIRPQRLTCTAPHVLPQNHKTEQQFGSSSDAQPALILKKLSLIGVENETYSLGLLFLWCLKDTESAALAKLRSASAGVHPKHSHNTHGLTHT